MNHRISAGAFVIQDNKLLLVNHHKPGSYDFWVAPGGGVIGTETLRTAAIREVKEETGLAVTADALLYIEEFWQPAERGVKFWFRCELLGGVLDTSAEEATRELIIDARFMGRDEIARHTVFPEPVNHNKFWQDIYEPEPAPQYLGLRAMDFY